MVQLPNDAISVGYKQTGEYRWEQVFYSSSCGFEGTEREFLACGLGYEYIQLDNYRRLLLW